jgi:hypothetical protein
VSTDTIAVERSASSMSMRMSVTVHTGELYAQSVVVATTSDHVGTGRGFAYSFNTRAKFTSIPAVAPQMYRPSCGST